MTLKELVSGARTYIFLFALVIAIVIGVTKWHKLPERVTKNEDNVQMLAGTVNEFVMEQRIIRVEEEKREKMMWDVIKTKKDK